jgi:hypothetical protein
MINQENIDFMFRFMSETAEAAEVRLKHLPHSGLSLVDKIQPNETVIDIGCGHHIFKKYIPNIVGIDPVYSAADHQVTLQDFKTDQKFNVAFCLGSLHYGEYEDIASQITKVVDLLTPSARIYWRFNIDPATVGYGFTRFIWTIEQSREFASQFGFVVTDYAYETIANTKKRLYVEWVRT